MMNKKVIVATDNLLHSSYAKTAHGLIRGTDRFDVLAVIDAKNAGTDAGEVMDGKHRGIPVIASIVDAINQFGRIDYLIIGVANKGGTLSDSLVALIKQAITHKIGIINGLHTLLNELDDVANMAKAYDVELIDIRQPRPVKELHFWTGEIFDVNVPIIAILGLDCAIGKRTTSGLMLEACQAEGIRAEMIYTGQTGWMQGSKHGFIFDSTVNDFVSGELEHAIVNCWKKEKPDVIFIEGQSSLRNPGGPCGLEMLFSGNAKQVVILHAPNRRYFGDEPKWGEIPSLESEIQIIEKLGSKVIGVALNVQGLTDKELKTTQAELENTLNIPVVAPTKEGVHRLVSAIVLKPSI